MTAKDIVDSVLITFVKDQARWDRLSNQERQTLGKAMAIRTAQEVVRPFALMGFALRDSHDPSGRECALAGREPFGSSSCPACSLTAYLENAVR